MGLVTEVLDGFPISDTLITVQRNEELLLTRPEIPFLPVGNPPNISAIHFPFDYAPKKFTPPQGIFESEHIRLEWQQMGPGVRQPFYHRNADVDELSYQICGERTLMTEVGTVELREGDFSRIPVGVGHDNYGREEIHLLFYIPAPVTEFVEPVRRAEFKMPPFPGWKGQAVSELLTECLGGLMGQPDCALSVARADETMILEHAQGLDASDLLQVLRTSGKDGKYEWLYKSQDVWIGAVDYKQGCSADTYRRHRRAEEIQCQIKGQRTLVSQRGTIDLEPGDFVSIPPGVAFADIVHGESFHISVLTRHHAEPKGSNVKEAKQTDWASLQNQRK